jgi:DNA-binding NtrC family response regulator
MNDKPLILTVDDSADSRYALERILKRNGYEVLSTSSGREAIELARTHSPSLILLDIVMPDIDGYTVTKQLKDDDELRFIPVYLVSAKDTLTDIVHGLDVGADGYIAKPFQAEELLARVKAALRLKEIYQELSDTKASNKALAIRLGESENTAKLVTESKVMQEVSKLLKKVAPTDSSVLITGPSGSGKELVARELHRESLRNQAPFVAINCAAISENLLESEIFGYLKGAFTGAIKDKPGLLEAAHGGTLFLDEIGEMPLALQAKLLRVIQERTYIPVGANTTKVANVRFVAATNRDLTKMMGQGSFREDLYFRLNVITIELPPLNQRLEDLVALIDIFLEKFSTNRRNAKPTLSEEVLSLFSRYSWPGNIRELQNEIERMLILSEDDEVLGLDLISNRISKDFVSSSDSVHSTKGALRDKIENLEKDMIYKALMASNWNKSVTAKELGISRSSLIQKVQMYGLEQE